jgi:hypothetical protein
VVISAIDGMAGIGKTALAVQWAHQVADRFPDGQLYVNLRGFDLAGPPVTPAEAVRGFLDAFEVPAARIPASLESQAARYRSLLARRAGIDLDVLRQMLATSAASTAFVRDDLGALLDGDYLTSFGLDRCCEELTATATSPANSTCHLS